ncbi:MAG TPA: TRAM domain-containing protein [Syntrophorhabdaceae bacterium]|nr:TRAM domain-containing protein [Syntrophorhabdaceae bacterium]
MILTAEKILPGGDCLARIDGKAVFLSGALPGEVVDAARRGGTPVESAEEISHTALDRGSTDNITVIVLNLRKYTSCLKNRKMVIRKVYDRA